MEKSKSLKITTASHQMKKAKKYNIEDSNIANLGTELEKSVKRAAAMTEEQWRNAGKTPGLQIWRIEKFKVVPWPTEKYGTFFSGDSYIILHTYKKNPDSNALNWDIHFWLGEFTTQDEAGTAAYKTVELDDVLGGAPVQHREVQGFETPLFMSYFSGKLEFLEGGVDSGFRHVEEKKYPARLLWIKGTPRNVVVREVPLSAGSLNSGDTFILDGGKIIYQWNGAKSHAMEKRKAAQLFTAIKDEREGAIQNASVVEEGQEDTYFWELLGGGSREDIKSPEQGGVDAEVVSKKKLFRLTDGEPVGKDKKKKEEDEDSSVPPISKFDAAAEAEVLHKALSKFVGKDSNIIVDLFTSRSNSQMQLIKEEYAKKYTKGAVGKGYNQKNKLYMDVKKKTKVSRDFRALLKAMLLTRDEHDALLCRTVIDGKLGTDNRLLVEIICSRGTNESISALKEAYHKMFARHLKEDVAKDTGGLFSKDYQKLMTSLLAENRVDTTPDPEECKRLAGILMKAGETKLIGTDQDRFTKFFATDLSMAGLRGLAEAYPLVSKKGWDMATCLTKQTSGNYRRALRVILATANGTLTDYYVKRLYKSMKGLGTNDRSLIRLMLVCKEGKLFPQIKPAFYRSYGRTLTHWLKGDTSGDYLKLLLKMTGEDNPKDYGQVEMQFKEVASGKVTRELLDSDDAFIFDTGFQVFVWIGKNASKRERKTGLQYAQMYLLEEKLPHHTPISRILEGGENEVFESSFDD